MTAPLDAPAADPAFPPLLSGWRTLGDAFAAAVEAAPETDPGAVFWSDRTDAFQAAIVLAPETPLRRAMAMIPAAQAAFVDALGAIGPPELPLHLAWPDAIRADGAIVARARAAASTCDPDAEPDWLVVGIMAQLAPVDDPTADQTGLWSQGAGDLTAPALVETWARHMLRWIHHWGEDGFRPLHDALIGRIVGVNGFVGLDEDGGALIETDGQTRLRPLTDMLNAAPAWPWEKV